MEDNEWDSNSFYGDKFPVNIPSPDAPWSAMRKKLENEKKRKAYRWAGVFLMAGIVLLSIITVNILSHSYGKKANTATNNKFVENAGETNKINTHKTNDTLLNQGHSSNKNITKANQSNAEIPGKTPGNPAISDTQSRNNFNPVKPVNPENEPTNVKVYPKKNNVTHGAKKFVVKNVRQHVAAGTISSVKDNQQADSILGEQPVKDSIVADIDKSTSLKNREQVTDSLQEDIVKEDAMEENNEQEDSIEENGDEDSTGFIAEAGLQWNVQLPFANGGSYFIGSGTQSQPYRILLPGIWINWNAGRSLLVVLVNPSASLLTPDKPFKTIVTKSTVSDTVITKTQTMTLNKLFGVTAGLGYDYNFAGNWWAGGNLQANWWGSGVASSSFETSKQSLSGSFSPVNTQSNTKHELSNVDWENLSAFQMQLNMEILYRKKTWMAGFNAGFPLTPISKSAGSLNYFYAALFFRLRVWTNEK